MKRILIVDDQAIIRFTLSEALQTRGFSVAVASDGDEALQLMRRQRPDLVLLDLTMPRLDGYTVLRCMRKSPLLSNLPVLVLTESAEKNVVHRIAKLSVKGYTLKSSFDQQAFMDAINAALNPATPVMVSEGVSDSDPEAESTATLLKTDQNGELRLREIEPILSHGEITSLLQGFQELRTMSSIGGKLAEITRKSECSITDVAQLIESEPALTLRILRLANSSAYAQAGPVETVERAVANIGMRRIEELVINLAVIDRFDEDTVGNHFNLLAFWEHAVTCATISAEIARMLGGNNEQVQTALMVGLLHDVGRLVFIESLGSRYRQVLDLARELKLPLNVIESHLLRVDHARVMKQVLEEWHFPEALVAPITYHHTPLNDLRRLAPKRIDQVVACALADRLAHGMLQGDSGNLVLEPARFLAEFLQLDAEELRQMLLRVPDMTTDLKMVLFSQQTNAAWPDQVKTIRDALGGSIRALYISEEPAFDPHSQFFQVIDDGSAGGTSELAVLHVEHRQQVGPLSQELLLREQHLDTGPLPLLILSKSGDIPLDSNVMANRRVAMLSSTVHLDDLVSVIRRLLGRDEMALAAA